RSFIGTPDGFVFRFEGFHRNDRAKDFFPCSFGAWQNVGQHGRLDKEALAVGGLATEYCHCALLLCSLQESLDSLEMLLGYQRTLLDVVAFDWVAHAQRFNLRYQLFYQFSFYFLVYQDAGTSAALLARVPEPCLANAFCNRVKIGILKDNNWCFATKFQVHSLQLITHSGGDRTPTANAAGHRHHGNFFMVRECLANLSAQACDHIEYTAWQDTRDQLSKFEYGQRRLFRRLENQRVACGENWYNLPRTH